MQIKVKDIVQNLESLNAISQLKIAGKTSYDIAKIYRLCSKEFKIYDEVRVKLIKEYGVENPETKIFEILKASDENKEKFFKELEEVLEKDVDLPVNKIPFDDFQKVNVEPIHLANLDWMIAEPVPV